MITPSGLGSSDDCNENAVAHAREDQFLALPIRNRDEADVHQVRARIPLSSGYGGPAIPQLSPVVEV